MRRASLALVTVIVICFAAPALAQTARASGTVKDTGGKAMKGATVKATNKDAYPSQDDQKAWLDTECNKAAADYTGGADLDAKKLILTWDLREQESWDAGSTKVNCKVASALPDKSGLQAVTGSIKVAPAGPDGGQPQDGGPPSDGGGGPATASSAPPSTKQNG